MIRRYSAETVIADTSFVVANFNEQDQYYARCRKTYALIRGDILLPQTIFAESAYLLQKQIGKERFVKLVRQLSTMKYTIIHLQPEDFLRAADILEKYADTRLDYIDATIAAVAERLEITTILTLDRRDFAPLRLAHVERFKLLPE